MTTIPDIDDDDLQSNPTCSTNIYVARENPPGWRPFVAKWLRRLASRMDGSAAIVLRENDAWLVNHCAVFAVRALEERIRDEHVVDYLREVGRLN